MNKYILNVVKFSFLLVLMCICCLYIKSVRVKSLNWSLNPKKHVLFMGASHVARAIDDSLLESAINLGQPSERYMYTYIKLQNLLKDNSQIDTIFLECSSTDLWQNTDYKYHTKNEQSLFLKAFWPYFNEEEWRVFMCDGFQPIQIIVSSMFDKYVVHPESILHLGGFLTNNPGYAPFDSTSVSGDWELNHIEEYGEWGCETNYFYLRRIIDLIKNKGIKLYLVYFPVYKPELFYDQDYCSQIRLCLFNDVDYLDYSDWQCSDEERLDAHHLNANGATRFTFELKERFNFK